MTLFQKFTLICLIGLFSGCAPGNGTSTPTIVPLQATATARTQNITPSPTATPIPPPSPTPTRTPFASPIRQMANPTGQAAPPTAATPNPPDSNGQNSGQVEVTTYAINLRQGPGMDYPVLKRAKSGDRLTVTAQSGDWLEVTAADGQSGWIYAGGDFIQWLDDRPQDLPTGQINSPPQNQRDNPQIPAQLGSEPDSGRLIFAARSGGNLYAVNPDGSTLTQLTQGIIDPAVSPDGQRVAYTRWDGAEFGAVYLLDLDTGQERVIANDIRQPKAPTWSPDGSHLVISFQHGGVRDPQRQCRKFAPGEDIRIPENSTILWAGLQDDGRIRICFIRNEDLQWRLRKIVVSTGESEDLPSDLYAFAPAWDPQQDWRVIYSGSKGLMALDVNRNEEWPLTQDLRDKEAVFSPDGSKLAITYQQHDHWEVYTYNLETGARQRLTKPPILANPQYNSAAPAWSPDGSQIAFFTDRSGVWEIWVMNADGGNPRPVLPLEVQHELELAYNGVNERLLNWIR